MATPVTTRTSELLELLTQPGPWWCAGGGFNGIKGLHRDNGKENGNYYLGLGFGGLGLGFPEMLGSL